MSFQESDEALPVNRYLSFEDDGAQHIVILLGEPWPRATKFRGRDRVDFCFPVATVDGLRIWTTNARNYRFLRDYWPKLVKGAIEVTRRGKKNDPHTVYLISSISRVPPALRKAAKAITDEEIADARDVSAAAALDGAAAPT